MDHPDLRHTNTLSNGGFEEPEDGFADDDLLATDDMDITPDGIPQSRSFLEREDFESELGSLSFEQPSEDFNAISAHEIVEVIADGDRVARPIVVIYAYRLPSNKSIDHRKLLLYLQHTLDNVVELDYTIVYFHYGLRSHNKPPIRWLFQAYKVLDRKYKKNLKALYVVHPTRFIKIVWTLFKPFISSKFENKIHYANGIRELEEALNVSKLNLPSPIRDHDAKVSSGNVAGSRPGTPPTPPRPTQQFNVSLEFILAHNPDHDIPPIVSELIEFLEEHALDMEGIFRKSANVGSIRRLQERIDRGEHIDFVKDAEYEDNRYVACTHASVLLKTFLRYDLIAANVVYAEPNPDLSPTVAYKRIWNKTSLGEPVITNALYPMLAELADVAKGEKTPVVQQLVDKLPKSNYILLKTIVRFLCKVAENSKVNLMTANNLSVVFGPNLTWPTNQQVPVSQLNNLNNFCYRLIVDYDKIFIT